MEEVHTGNIGREGAVRPVTLALARDGESRGVVRATLACPDAGAVGGPAATVAAVLSAAAGRYLAEQTAPAAAGRFRRRATRWTVAGRLDALGMDGFHRWRVEARKRPMQTFQVTIEGRAYEVTVEEIRPASPQPTERPSKKARKAPAAAEGARAGERAFRAPMPGKVLAVHVGEQDSVAAGTVLLVLEAMKMENDVLASGDGTVKAVHVRPGDTVNAGDVMLVIE
jgi:glutaconyl-CoA/methylmalonyl-CoA decarboxylase subunit gamma